MPSMAVNGILQTGVKIPRPEPDTFITPSFFDLRSFAPLPKQLALVQCSLEWLRPFFASPSHTRAIPVEYLPMENEAAPKSLSPT